MQEQHEMSVASFLQSIAGTLAAPFSTCQNEKPPSQKPEVLDPSTVLRAGLGAKYGYVTNRGLRQEPMPSHQKEIKSVIAPLWFFCLDMAKAIS